MIPVYRPWLTSLEKKYVNEALGSTWIANGKFIDKAEELFADFIGVNHCVLTTSGTTALHLALRALDSSSYLRHFGITAIPNITFIATAFASSYDSRPIKFVDIDPNTWNMDLDELDELCSQQPVSTVIPVHLYGNPVDMEGLIELQKKHGFNIIEDACEAIGAEIKGKKAGAWGEIACFSFYANKTFSAGEGGALVTDDKDLADRARLLRGQAQDPNKRYWHIDIGYNYRITNIQAAILCAQIERSKEILAEKERVANRYLKNLEGHCKFQTVLDGHKHSYWLISIELTHPYEKIAHIMKEGGVETRKIFFPITEMPPYTEQNFDYYPNSEKLSKFGMSLPSYPELSNQEIDSVCDLLKLALT